MLQVSRTLSGGEGPERDGSAETGKSIEKLPDIINYGVSSRSAKTGYIEANDESIY